MDVLLNKEEELSYPPTLCSLELNSLEKVNANVQTVTTVVPRLRFAWKSTTSDIYHQQTVGPLSRLLPQNRACGVACYLLSTLGGNSLTDVTTSITFPQRHFCFVVALVSPGVDGQRWIHSESQREASGCKGHGDNESESEPLFQFMKYNHFHIVRAFYSLQQMSHQAET